MGREKPGTDGGVEWKRALICKLTFEAREHVGLQARVLESIKCDDVVLLDGRLGGRGSGDCAACFL